MSWQASGQKHRARARPSPLLVPPSPVRSDVIGRPPEASGNAEKRVTAAEALVQRVQAHGLLGGGHPKDKGGPNQLTETAWVSHGHGGNGSGGVRTGFRSALVRVHEEGLDVWLSGETRWFHATRVRSADRGLRPLHPGGSATRPPRAWSSPSCFGADPLAYKAAGAVGITRPIAMSPSVAARAPCSWLLVGSSSRTLLPGGGLFFPVPCSRRGPNVRSARGPSLKLFWHGSNAGGCQVHTPGAGARGKATSIPPPARFATTPVTAL